jgi:hypothetical protein
MTTAARPWRIVAVVAVLAMTFMPQRPDGTLSMRRARNAAAHMEARTADVGFLVADGRALTEVAGAVTRRTPLRAPVLFGAVVLLLVIAAGGRRCMKQVAGCGRRLHAGPGAVLLRAPPTAI